ncbi:MAG: peptidylprolyl isomerase [Nitrospinae bacterium]|nr:peptidylprolyl isomerase [Nitrospinota bacterium]
MSEQPKESEKTIYQRDKTAKEPQPVADAPKVPAKPKPKIKKVFVPKKATFTTDKPMEHRVRNIRLTSKESAKMIWDILIDFQNDLAKEEMDDPDKPFHDWEKVEKFFIRLAKKYSTCQSKKLGGDLGWVYRGMTLPEQIITDELLEEVMKLEKLVLPDPIQSKLGYHLLMICESQVHTPQEKLPEKETRPLF